MVVRILHGTGNQILLFLCGREVFLLTEPSLQSHGISTKGLQRFTFLVLCSILSLEIIKVEFLGLGYSSMMSAWFLCAIPSTTNKIAATHTQQQNLLDCSLEDVASSSGHLLASFNINFFPCLSCRHSSALGWAMVDWITVRFHYLHGVLHSCTPAAGEWPAGAGRISTGHQVGT